MTALRDRAAWLSVLVVSSLILSFLLRAALYHRFHPGPFSLLELSRAWLVGAFYDLPAKLLFLTPVVLYLGIGGGRTLASPRWRFALTSLLLALATFQSVIEYYFFDEYNSRFNHVALDYVRNPDEVLGNIWESYNVPLVGGLALGAGLLLTIGLGRWCRGGRFSKLNLRQRGSGVLAGLSLLIGSFAALHFLPEIDDSKDRVLAEISGNGMLALVRAFRTATLDYFQYYATMRDDLAAARAVRVFHPASTPSTPAAATPQDWDVVVILEESFGSEFIGVLGHPKRKTSPGFDRWSERGLLLTNLVPTGNRTVRGLEATLCSLPPLPGDAILKHEGADDVATLARVFAAHRYRTAFLYGGYGTFDSMKPFMPDNGFQEFIDRADLPKDAFSTIWGVADEYLFTRLLERQREARRRGERLFATALTVSNHKPYDVPDRPTLVPAKNRSREAAVAYADWALADYLDRAEREGLLDHTLVLALGDHGARVYGKQLIPIASYRIPALFVIPGSEWDGKRIDRIASQIDLGPTLFSLLGWPQVEPFFGSDVTRSPADGGRAFVQHNRNIGLLTDRALVVLGLKKRIEYYSRAGRHSNDLQPVDLAQAPAEYKELELDAIAAFQTAYDMVHDHRYQYRPNEKAAASAATAGNSR